MVRDLVGSRRIEPLRSRVLRWFCTVELEERPTASPTSRTVGGYPRIFWRNFRYSRISRCRFVSGSGIASPPLIPRETGQAPIIVLSGKARTCPEREEEGRPGRDHRMVAHAFAPAKSTQPAVGDRARMQRWYSRRGDGSTSVRPAQTLVRSGS